MCEFCYTWSGSALLIKRHRRDARKDFAFKSKLLAQCTWRQKRFYVTIIGDQRVKICFIYVRLFFLLLLVPFFFFFVNSILIFKNSASSNVFHWINLYSPHYISFSKMIRSTNDEIRIKGAHGRPFTQLHWSNTRTNNTLQKNNTKASVNLLPNLMWQSRPLRRLTKERRMQFSMFFFCQFRSSNYFQLFSELSMIILHNLI